jgi:hypothetical protein
MESINEAYKTRVDGLTSAHADKNKEAEQVEKDSGIESTDTPLVEEQRFVANPDELRKDASSEDEFSEGLTNGDDTLESTSEKPAKKSAAKKG